MASNSRIDKFFGSRKRKAVSPGLKIGRSEDVKVSNQVSPSAKGSLDGYLVTYSQDGDDATKRRGTVCGLSPGKDTVRRNLALEIDKDDKDKSRPNVAAREHVQLQSSESSRYSREVVSAASNDEVKVAIRHLSKDCLASDVGPGSSELKRFATDFLSLYCSELQSSTILLLDKQIDNKRSASSIGDGDEHTTNKRHCINNMLEIEAKRTCYDDGNCGNKKSHLIKGIMNANTSGEVDGGNDSIDLQASLRRCNKALISTAIMTELHTPGSSNSKVLAHGTPTSAHGSSMFSPGEAFWSEAIQLVDGLCCPVDKFSNCGNQVYEKSICEQNHSVKTSVDLQIGKCIEETEKTLIAGESKNQLRVDASLGAPGKHTKDSSKKVSQLPVKHFDFSQDETNFDDTTAYCCTEDYPKDGKVRTSGEFEYGSVTKSHPTMCVLTHCDGAKISEDVDEDRKLTSIHAPSKENVVSDQDGDKISSNLHIGNFSNCVGNGKYDEASTPSSYVPHRKCLELRSWLPPEICQIYIKKGISKLYPWQIECLQVDGVLQKRNLVYCASTSAGKSFVAEILMLRRVISTGKMALLVLPYVSICTEKAEHLEVLLEPLGKRVRSYFANQGGGTLPKDTSVAVCTIEKANFLINRLLEEGRLSELGIIVIDELHMVGDQNRGYLLELMLTKLRYAAGEGNSDSTSGESSGSSSGKADPDYGLQIVGMSATMPNVAAVADWLCAALYETDFRPVPLEEYIKVDNTIYNKNMDIVRTIPKAANLGGKDPDHIVELCNEVVQEGHSVLIFCSSRKGCESTARHVSKFIKRFSVNSCNDNSEYTDIGSAIDSLRKCPAGLDPTLEETLPAGVAYHHAGLTVEEREVVETCYRRGLVRVLTATSTLAAGVNLPARRVIFRQPKIGYDFIDGIRYKQMAGRAGRTGIDTKGESVLICKPEEVKRIMGLLNQSCPPLHSCLSEDKNGMTHAILEVVAGGIVQTAKDIHRYVKCTLLNSTKPFQDVVKSAQDSLRWLCHRKFLEWSEETKLYSTTPLGCASFGSMLCPEESLIVLDDLLRAREGFVLASDLHLVYLVTPTNVDVEPDWEIYYERFMQLSPLEQSVGNRVGVAEPFLMRMAHGAPLRMANRSINNTKRLHGTAEMRFSSTGPAGNSMPSDEHTLRVSKRFYVALILSKLVQEAPVTEVCELFKVARGMVQALQENAGRFASMVSVFCERLGWHDLEGLVSKFQNRISFGVRAEIVELTTIPYVKGSRARALYKAGLRTPLAIAEASIPEIAKALFESSSWSAQEGTAQRRLQLGVAKKIKNGARKIVLEKAEEARAAAFSAFKSLGLDVPQFSQPINSLSPASSSKQGASPSSSNDDNTINVVGLQPKEHPSEKQTLESNQDFDKPNVNEGKKLTKIADVGLTALTKKSSHGDTPRNLNSANHVGPVRGSVTMVDKLETRIEHTSTADLIAPKDLGKIVNEPLIRDENLGQEQCSIGSLPTGSNRAAEIGPVSVTSTPGGIDSFFDLWEASCEFFFDIHYNKRAEINSIVPFEMHGMAICWENSPVYYVDIPQDLLGHKKRKINPLSPSMSSTNRSNTLTENWLQIVQQRWKRVEDIMRKRGVRKFSWNMKVQIQVLKKVAVSVHRFSSKNLADTMKLKVIEGSYVQLAPVHIMDGVDMSIVSWILWPDEESNSYPNLEKEVKKRVSAEAVAAANQSGRWRNQMRRAAHNGCCRRVAQIRVLYTVLWKLLNSEMLLDALTNVEMPLVYVLADMELSGIGIDMERCLQARNLLAKKLRLLEKEAYKQAGMTFSLYTAADIANVLYGHLKLPVPEGRGKGKQHPSTDKHCLDLLRHEHPIIPVIKEHRSLAKLLNCTLGSICSLARLSLATQKYTLHGHWLQTSTATGRLSMEEPNLQCVEHTVDFKMNHKKNGNSVDGDQYSVNARDFFVPTRENWLILTADYSQIELRLMAHFSKDSSLIEILSKPNGDVFIMIAARWTGKAEDSVSSNERDQVKRLIYGILYGMGPNTLAEKLSCSPDEASNRIKSFKSSFPGVALWLNEAVASCRERGYIETLNGRKRFLSKIKFGTSKEKSKAERQAVNSICQGSAADIIKIAMVKIHSVISEAVYVPKCCPSSVTKYSMLKGHCHILLQVHDELVLEVDPSMINEAASLLQESMESAASLLVPLHVKLEVGRTWGSMEASSIVKYKDEILVPHS